MRGARSRLPEELLARVIAELAGELARPSSDIQIELVEPVTWHDGSLGCPEPGMFYTQALIPGFRLILVVDGQRFDYRTGRGGIHRRCDLVSDGSGPATARMPGGDRRSE